MARRTARKVLQRIGRRWPDERLLDEIELLRSRINDLQLVHNAAERDGDFVCLVPGTLEERRLYQSRFNMAWLDELRISPKVVLDVGAYDGGDSIRFKYRFPDARVVAFEADPERHRIVSDNVAPFGIICVNAAVCDRDAPVSWYQSHDGRFRDAGAGSQGSMYRHSPEYARRYDFVTQGAVPMSIEGVRIDTFCARASVGEVDVAHIDAEGAEHDVVAGFGRILPKLVYVEAASFGGWIGARQPRELHRKLSSMGYALAAELINDRLYVRADLVRLFG
ncbi:MAG: FkbM family methyltransferase [Hyphomicrobiales bacterium]|nr:FkbM family methyltransferase [Hyphomicrobiales bacterium]